MKLSEMIKQLQDLQKEHPEAECFVLDPHSLVDEGLCEEVPVHFYVNTYEDGKPTQVVFCDDGTYDCIWDDRMAAEAEK